MKLFSVSELANFLSVSTQAIYIAIKANKFPNCFKEAGENGKSFWTIPENDVAEYQKKKYSRDHFYNFKKNEMSVNAAAECLGLTSQSVYNLIKSGYLPHKKNGWHYILFLEDVMKMKSSKESTEFVVQA